MIAMRRAYDRDMSSASKRSFLRDARAASIVAAVAVALWLALRASGPLKPDVYFGWLCLLLIVGTVVEIAHTSYADGGAVLRGLLSLSATLLVLIVATALAGGYLGINETLTVSALFIIWLSFCAASTWRLRPFGPAAANAIALVFAMILMASPVVDIPLVRAAATWGQGGSVSPWQDRIIHIISGTCPFFALLDAVRPTMKIDWSHLPAMYEWSGLGQDIPMLLPNAWLSVGVYAAATAAFMPHSKRESRQPDK